MNKMCMKRDSPCARAHQLSPGIVASVPVPHQALDDSQLLLEDLDHLLLVLFAQLVPFHREVGIQREHARLAGHGEWHMVEQHRITHFRQVHANARYGRDVHEVWIDRPGLHEEIVFFGVAHDLLDAECETKVQDIGILVSADVAVVRELGSRCSVFRGFDEVLEECILGQYSDDSNENS